LTSTHATPRSDEDAGELSESLSPPRGIFGIPIGITAKLVIMVAVPLAALAIVLALDIADRLSRQRDLQSLVVASGLISAAEQVTDGLQLERGASSLYLSSDGSMYRRELIEQWDATDAAIIDFKDTLGQTGDGGGDGFLARRSSDLLAALTEVDVMRQRILDLEATWPDAMAYYSDLIQQLHASPDGLIELTHLDPQLTGILMGILHLSDAADAAGLERALISKVLTEGTIRSDDVELLDRLAGRQADSLEWFRNHVPPEIRVAHQGKLPSAGASPVQMARQQLADGDLSLDPGAWFDISTAPVETISSIQDDLLVGLADRSAELSGEARSSMWWFSAFGVLVLAASLLVAHLVGRRLSKRTIALARVAQAIQEGDLSQRADADVGDELGTLGLAFNRMTDDLTTSNRVLEGRVADRTVELQASEERYRAMLEAIPDLIFRLSSDGVYVDFVFVDTETSDAPRIFPRPEQFVGKHIEDVLSPELASNFLAASRRARETGEVQQLEYEYPMGEVVREREARIVSIPGADETMVVARDITDRKAQDRDLQDLIRSKDELIASISHELRTPLTTVIGFSELLGDADSDISPAERAEMIDSITEQAMDISHIVEDLLVAARAKIDTLRVAHVPVDLREQLAQVLGGWREASVDKIVIEGESAIALGDPGRVRQILRNLLTNAVRYGGERVEVRMSSTGATAILQVCDDGPGVPEGDQGLIFEPYHQSHAVPGRPGSVGLGLTVSRILAQLMGGELTYRRERGNSIFEVTLAAPQILDE